MKIELTPQEYLEAAGHEVRMRRWRDESADEYTVHHLEVQGDTDPAILRWYLRTYSPESYLLWHPSHLMHVREAVQPTEGRRFVVLEWINGWLQADRMWGGAPLDLCPVAPDHPESAVLTAVLDTDGTPFRHILAEVEDRDGGGLISRGTWTFPAATPEDYVQGLLAHCREERLGMLERAIPYAIQRYFGYTPSTEQIKEALGLEEGK